MTVKRPPHRPLHQPTEQARAQVQMAAAFGNTEDEIAMLIGIAPKTLRLHYAEELATGHLKVAQRVAANLVRQALKDDWRAFPAIKFYLNCKCGWSEYAPSDEKMGKKEQAQIIAETAEVGTGWAHLVH